MIETLENTEMQCYLFQILNITWYDTGKDSVLRHSLKEKVIRFPDNLRMVK